jgi:hypothetical protein
MMSGLMPTHSCAIQLAGATDACLHFIENQQKALLVADLAQHAHEFLEETAQTAFALNGSNRMPAVSSVIAARNAASSPNGT